MVKRNPHVGRLHPNYLFPEIAQRKERFLQRNPGAHCINLGIGNTTHPLPFPIVERLAVYGYQLSTAAGYSGYGPEQGTWKLREAVAAKMYAGKISPEEIFISDGTKCDIGRLQLLFGSGASMAVQDPAYPVYVDTAMAAGMGAGAEASAITYMPCTPDNGFFPCLETLSGRDLIYFCSPNNPTGAVASRAQLEALVRFAKNSRSILIFDAAYAVFIQDPLLPRSIYEIDGAEEVAIELGSFSKMAGFTGLRLGWSVIPRRLRFEEGGSVHADWRRIHTTFFNGASNVVQEAGLAVLEEEGWRSTQGMIAYYRENARLIFNLFASSGFRVYGGKHAPYIWVEFPGKGSWEAFEELLESVQIITTPGSGFGPAGEGFLRFSAFASREEVIEAISRLKSRVQKT